MSENKENALSSPSQIGPSRYLKASDIQSSSEEDRDSISKGALDLASLLTGRSPGQKIFNGEKSRSPEHLRNIDVDILARNHSSRSGLSVVSNLFFRSSQAEEAVIAFIQKNILKSCFQFMKALKHWRRRLIINTFMEWWLTCKDNRKVREIEHIIHQREVLEQRASLNALVSHHTASSRAKSVEESNSNSAMRSAERINKPSFRPASGNSALHAQPKVNMKSLTVKKRSPSRSSESRHASVQFLNKKYFPPPERTNRISPKDVSKSRSTTPTPLVVSVSSLSDHPFYQSRREDNGEIRAPVVVAEPGFEHKILATPNLSVDADTAVQAFIISVQLSPDRMMRSSASSTPHSLTSPSRALHENTKRTSAPRTPQRQLSAQACSARVGSPLSEYDSPSAAEVAYALSRGSGLLDVYDYRTESHSPLVQPQGERVLSPKKTSPDVINSSTNKEVVLPAAPRRGKLQALLSQRTRSVHLQACSTDELSTSAHNHSVGSEKSSKDSPCKGKVILVASSDEPASFHEDTSTCTDSKQETVVVQYSLHFKYLVFRRVQRKIVKLQEKKTFELDAILPAMEYHWNVQLRVAFSSWRAYYFKTKISQHRSYDSAINTSNYALTKAFWKLRKNVSYRYKCWFVEQRGVKYHRLVRLSQGFSALSYLAAFGNKEFSGDRESLRDDEEEKVSGGDDRAGADFAAVSLVQGLSGFDLSYEQDSSDSNIDYRNRSDDSPEDFLVQTSDGDRSDSADVEQEPADVQALTRWEDDHFSTDDSLSEERERESDSESEVFSGDSSTEEDNHASFTIGPIAALGLCLRSGENSPIPRSLPTSALFESFMHAPTDPQVNEILQQISRSRSSEAPGVSGMDLWDWQDLHSLSREFISDSEFDSSQEATEVAIAPFLPEDPSDETEDLAVTTRLSRVCQPMSPIYAPSMVAPLLQQGDGAHQDAGHLGESDEESDLSLFLSDDESGGEEEMMNIATRFSDTQLQEARVVSSSPSPLSPPTTSLTLSSNISELELPPLPDSPCPSETETPTPPTSARSSEYMSDSDSSTEKIDAAMRSGRAYWHRTKLLQGLYGFNQWVVKSQTILTMNDILFEFQQLRKMRRGLKILKNTAML